LVNELDEGGSEFRRATILELLRVRTVVDVAGRRVQAEDVNLGEWRIRRGRTVLVRIADLHDDPNAFPHPELFDPYRFRSAKPPTASWLPFGGGERRCLGAQFALLEIDEVLRTVLQTFRLHTDAAADEKPYFRGIAHTPKQGALVVLNRRI
jgi:cytochrome P450